MTGWKLNPLRTEVKNAPSLEGMKGCRMQPSQRGTGYCSCLCTLVSLQRSFLLWLCLELDVRLVMTGDLCVGGNGLNG